MTFSKKNRKKTLGMTLVEVIVACSLGVVVLGSASWFTLEVMRASYMSMADLENSIQQWGLSTKLQIDGKIANGATIFKSASESSPDYLLTVPMDNGVIGDGLERGNVLVLSKSVVDSAGNNTALISDVIFYLYTEGSAPDYGTLKRYPAKAPETFKVTAPTDDKGVAKTVAQIVDENIAEFTGSAVVIQKQVASAASNLGPFAHLGNPNNVSIALVRNEIVGKKKHSNLTEVSFNLR